MKEKQHLEPIFVSVKKAATLMDVSDDTVYRLVRNGELPSVKIGGFRKIRVADIRDFGRSQVETPDSIFDSR